MLVIMLDNVTLYLYVTKLTVGITLKYNKIYMHN